MMLTIRGMARAAVIGGLGLAIMLGGVHPLPSQAAADKEGKKALESKADTAPPAGTIDFAAALGMDLVSLRTIGGRIDQARWSCDPVALAAIAKELGAAEEASGKKAALTAEKLTKEAAELAHFRNRPSELKTVAVLIGGAAKDELLKQATETGKEIEARKGGERSRGVEGRLYVDNHTGYFVDIFIDGENRGTVKPYHIGTVYVGAASWQATRLFGHAPGTSHTWGPRLVDYRVNDYTWNLYD
jgi:hypothetical protein